MAKFVIILIASVYVVYNLIVAKMMSASDMRKEFVQDQCVVGGIFANLFYSPAWFLKGLRFIVLAMIK